MKKVFLVIATIGFSIGMNAQTPKTPNSKSIRNNNRMRSDSAKNSNAQINAQVMTENGMNPNGLNNNNMGIPDNIPNKYVNEKMQKNKNKKRKFAMNNNSISDSNMRSPMAKGTESDGLVMKNGKMMETKNGNMTEMNYNITLVNGTKVTNDGYVINKSGNKRMLIEGEFVDFYGNSKTMKNYPKNR